MSEERVYVDGQVNAFQTSIPAIVNVNRQGTIIQDTTGWAVAVDRFELKNCRLPLFDTTMGSWSIAFRGNDNVVHTQTVSWSAYAGLRDLYETNTPIAGQYLYNYRDFAGGINIAFDTLGNTLVIPGIDRPTFTFNPEDNTFSITTTANFRGAYDILVSQSFYVGLSTFRYRPGVDNLFLVETNEDIEKQDVDTLESLSPVERIALSPTGIPTKYTNSAEPASQQNVITDSTSSILDDVAMTSFENKDTTKILFLSDLLRIHDMMASTSLRSFIIEFYWVDTLNVLRAITLPPGGKADFKLVFIKRS
jgi:hypothetical protein